MPWFTLLIGAVLGGLMGGRFETAVAGGFIGLVVGLVLNASRKSRVAPTAAPAAADADPLSLLDPRVAERLRAMERRIATLESTLREAAPATIAAALPPVTEAAQPNEAVPHVSPPREDERVVAMETPRKSDEAPAMPAYGRQRSVASAESGVSAIPQPWGGGRAPATPFSTLWRWLTGGNMLARVGILVLFVGVAFLLKYATEHVVVPIELRIAAVALGGVVLLVLGWRLRERRAGYAMILQGGGVGVLYLTVFAALRLYALVPAPAAFALLIAIAAFSGVLAVRQDAIGLAVVGVVGGFAAPILTSSQSGNHVMLFAYYALLDAGILGIAWFKAWRLLNVLGFACTFVIGTLWGVTRYRAGDFGTTEPFLVLFFLFYVAIAVLYALRRSTSVRDYVDGTIVFGTPLVTAGLQEALVRPYEFGMAISAVAAAALYLVLARVLWSRHRDELRLLSESFLALGVVFATLAVPLAVDAHWTSATWALEGAAIVWVGARQRRVLARAFGLLLQVAAGVAFALGAHHAPADALPIVNSAFVGAALVALGGLVSALVYERRAADIGSAELRLVLALAFAWGTLWWLFAGAQEIERFVAAPRRPAVLVAFLTATAAGFALASRALAWPLARVAAMLLAPALLALALFRVGMGTVSGVHLFAAGGALAWPLAVVVGIASLRFFEREGACPPGSPSAGALHGAWLWLVALVAADEIAWTAAQYTTGAAWRSVPWGLVPALAIATVCRVVRGTTWPIGVHRRAYLTVGAAPLVAWMLVWSLVVGVASDGDPSPLPYVPLVNPVDLTLAFIAAALLAWIGALRRDGVDIDAQVPRTALIGVAAAFAFLWINAIALRALHHAFGIDWSLGALWDATIVQAALSLLWTVIALAAMVVANRAGARDGWIAGAVLLAVVVVKLFAVDLSRIGSVERIVSFIGVGLLLLAIGYLAPVPARKEHAP